MAATSDAELLKTVLTRHAANTPSHGRIVVCPVFDDEHGHYGLVDVGWDRGLPVHSLIFFARVTDGSIRLEWDGLGYGITDELISAGIPESRLIHAWMEPCPPEAAARPRSSRAASA